MDDFCLIEVRVTPRSSREKMEVCADGTFKIWVNAAPVEGEANEAVYRLMAKTIGVAASRITLFKGSKGRNKTFRIEGMTREEFDRAVQGGGK